MTGRGLENNGPTRHAQSRKKRVCMLQREPVLAFARWCSGCVVAARSVQREAVDMRPERDRARSRRPPFAATPARHRNVRGIRAVVSRGCLRRTVENQVGDAEIGPGAVRHGVEGRSWQRRRVRACAARERGAGHPGDCTAHRGASKRGGGVVVCPARTRWRMPCSGRTATDRGSGVGVQLRGMYGVACAKWRRNRSAPWAPVSLSCERWRRARRASPRGRAILSYTA